MPAAPAKTTARGDTTSDPAADWRAPGSTVSVLVDDQRWRATVGLASQNTLVLRIDPTPEQGSPPADLHRTTIVVTAVSPIGLQRFTSRPRDAVSHTDGTVVITLDPPDDIEIIERRECLRLPCHRPVLLRPVRSTKEVQGTTVDLSSTGVGIRTRRPVPDADLDVEITFAEGVLKATGRVAWEDQDAEGRFRAGLHFVAVSGPAQRLLAQELVILQRRAAPRRPFVSAVKLKRLRTSRPPALGVTSELGRTGARLECWEEVPVDTAVLLEVELHGRTLRADASVVTCQPVRGGKFEVDLDLLELGAEDRNHLLSWLSGDWVDA